MQFFVETRSDKWKFLVAGGEGKRCSVRDDILISGAIDNNMRKSYENDVRANILSLVFLNIIIDRLPPPL